MQKLEEYCLNNLERYLTTVGLCFKNLAEILKAKTKRHIFYFNTCYLSSSYRNQKSRNRLSEIECRRCKRQNAFLEYLRPNSKWITKKFDSNLSENQARIGKKLDNWVAAWAPYRGPRLTRRETAHWLVLSGRRKRGSRPMGSVPPKIDETALQ